MSNYATLQSRLTFHFKIPSLPLPFLFARFQRPEILAGQANEILTAVVQGARKEEQRCVCNTETVLIYARQLTLPLTANSQDVQLAALHALLNSLEFVRENFNNDVSNCVWGEPFPSHCMNGLIAI